MHNSVDGFGEKGCRYSKAWFNKKLWMVRLEQLVLLLFYHTAVFLIHLHRTPNFTDKKQGSGVVRLTCLYLASLVAFFYSRREVVELFSFLGREIVSSNNVIRRTPPHLARKHTFGVGTLRGELRPACSTKPRERSFPPRDGALPPWQPLPQLDTQLRKWSIKTSRNRAEIVQPCPVGILGW